MALNKASSRFRSPVQFKPNSSALKVTMPVQSVRDLAADERSELLGDLGNWADSISNKDAKLKVRTRSAPPPPSHGSRPDGPVPGTLCLRH